MGIFSRNEFSVGRQGKVLPVAKPNVALTNTFANILNEAGLETTLNYINDNVAQFFTYEG